MIYILDTNILLHYIRQDNIGKHISRFYAPHWKEQPPILSVVSIGEIKSIAKQNAWGSPKNSILEQLLRQLLHADITMDIIERYAEIDAYSQNKLLGQPLELTPRNMGKNDLWIAATASVLGAKLLTTDSDFDHLRGSYIDIEDIDTVRVYSE